MSLTRLRIDNLLQRINETQLAENFAEYYIKSFDVLNIIRRVFKKLKKKDFEYDRVMVELSRNLPANFPTYSIKSIRKVKETQVNKLECRPKIEKINKSLKLIKPF